MSNGRITVAEDNTHWSHSLFPGITSSEDHMLKWNRSDSPMESVRQRSGHVCDCDI